MLDILLLTLLASQAAPKTRSPPAPAAKAVVTIDALPLEQAAAARCAVAFATVSRWQKTGDARGAGYPDIAGTGGREFFVRVMARLMDEAGLSREDVIALTARVADDNEVAGGEARIKAIMPACIMMKAAAGL